MIDRDKIFDALCLIIKYNGLADFLNYLMTVISVNRITKLSAEQVKIFYYDLHPDNDLWIFSTYDYGQLEIVWMFLVLLFGEYGTSPRSGWIDEDNFEEAYNFMEEIFDNM